MQIEFYRTGSGKAPVEEFIKQCSLELQEKLLDALSWLENGRNLSLPLSRPLFNAHRGLHELRLKDSSGIIRIFYYIKKHEAIYIIHALRKKTQAIPSKELALVLKRIKELS